VCYSAIGKVLRANKDIDERAVSRSVQFREPDKECRVERQRREQGRCVLALRPVTFAKPDILWKHMAFVFTAIDKHQPWKRKFLALH
jgi:hypothetical protein